MHPIVDRLDIERPVLLAGPTASGKSALALEIAERTGGPIVNADALQVFADWRILTARPSAADEARVPHRLYGHVPGGSAYSVGIWLRDLTPLLDGPPPVIVGGTGLYFSNLVDGLADIPDVPSEVLAEADARLAEAGAAALAGDLDPETRARIDLANPARVRRAWSVLRATGRGLAAWQDDTPPPLLPLTRAQPLLMDAPKDWLTPRIARRVRQMLDGGAVEEARQNLPHAGARPSSKAIGANELFAHLRGGLPLPEVEARMIVATRRYAKRQRTWFRARMGNWQRVSAR